MNKFLLLFAFSVLLLSRDGGSNSAVVKNDVEDFDVFYKKIWIQKIKEDDKRRT